MEEERKEGQGKRRKVPGSCTCPYTREPPRIIRLNEAEKNEKKECRSSLKMTKNCFEREGEKGKTDEGKKEE